MVTVRCCVLNGNNSAHTHVVSGTTTDILSASDMLGNRFELGPFRREVCHEQGFGIATHRKATTVKSENRPDESIVEACLHGNSHVGR